MQIPMVRRGFNMAELLTVLALISALLVILYPTMAQGAKPNNKMESTCLENQRQLVQHALLMADDRDGRLPSANAFLRSLTALPPETFICPESGLTKGNTYGYNSYVQGVQVRTLPEPQSVYLCTDAAQDSQGVINTPNDIAGRHNGQAMYGYADGHVALAGPRQLPQMFFTRPPMSLLANQPLGPVKFGTLAQATNPATDTDVWALDGKVKTGAQCEIVNVQMPGGMGKAVRLTGKTGGELDNPFMPVLRLGKSWPQAYKDAHSSTTLMSFYVKSRVLNGISSNMFACISADSKDAGVMGRGWVWQLSRFDDIKLKAAWFPICVDPLPYYECDYKVPPTDEQVYLIDTCYLNMNPVNATGWSDPIDLVKRGTLFKPTDAAYPEFVKENAKRSDYYAQWRLVRILTEHDRVWIDFDHGADSICADISGLPDARARQIADFPNARTWHADLLRFHLLSETGAEAYYGDFRLQYL